MFSEKKQDKVACIFDENLFIFYNNFLKTYLFNFTLFVRTYVRAYLEFQLCSLKLSNNKFLEIFLVHLLCNSD